MRPSLYLSTILYLISVLIAPVVSADIFHLDDLDLQDNSTALSIHNDYVFCSDGSGGLYVVDAGDPRELKILSNITFPDKAWGAALEGNYAFISARSAGLRVVDISDLEDLSEIASLSTPDYARDVVVHGSYLYLAVRESGLMVIDVSDPENPDSIMTIDTPGNSIRLQIKDDVLYMADGEEGLRLYDVSNPEDPQFLCDLDLPGTAWGVDVEEDRAYVAARDAGLRIIDVSDLENISELGYLDTDGFARDVRVVGGVAIIADSDGGMKIIDVSDSQNPQIIETVNTSGDVWDLALVGSLAYLAIGNSGVAVYDIVDLICAGGESQTITVPDDHRTIQSAILASCHGDEIHVEHGTYIENINFMGREISLIGDPDNPINVVIDGSNNGPVVMFEHEETSAAFLNGFTIQNGSGRIHDNKSWGGGIVCWRDEGNPGNGASPTIKNCVITGNTAARGGGIVINYFSHPKFTDCTISENASEFGGAIAMFQRAEVTFERCLITSNEAEDAGFLFTYSNTDAIFRNCTITNNISTGQDAGLVYARDTDITDFNSSILWSNSPGWFTFYDSESMNDVRFEYSAIEVDQDDIIHSGLGRLIWGEGNIDQDPKFVDDENQDYHLQRISPCINTGNPDDSYNDPDGSRNDMGAFYFESVEPGNYAVSLDGQSAGGIIEHDDNYNFGSGDFTIETMFRLHSWPNAHDVRLLSRTISNQEYVALQIIIGNNFPLFSGRGGGVEWVLNNDYEIELDTWYHIAGVREGDLFTCYVNGEDIVSGEYNVGSVEKDGSPQPWAIGCHHWENDGHVSYFTDGDFEETRIWNVPRSNEEICQNAWVELEDNEEGLVGYWNLNEGQGTSIIDSSPNGNNGTLYPEYEWIEADYDKGWESFEVDNNTLALWHFDEAEGDTAYDETENDNDAELVGNVDWSCGLWGSSVDVQFWRNNYLFVEDNESIRPQEFTVECWFKMSEEDENGVGVLFGKDYSADNSPGANSFKVGVDQGNGNAWVQVWTNSLQQCFAEGLDIRREIWHHIAGTCDGEKLQLWFDGELVEELEFDGQISYDDGPIVFASEPDNPGTNTIFTGKIEEIRFSDAVRYPFFIPEPNILVEPTTLDFGSVEIYNYEEMSFSISNTADADLTVTDIDVTGNYFSTDFSDEITISPEEELNINVTFSPEEVGDFEEIISVYSNDPDNPEIDVSLSGTGLLPMLSTSVFAMKSIWMMPGSKILSGDVWVNEDIGGRCFGGTPELTVGYRAVIESESVKADKILINRQAAVTADIHYNTLINRGTITGEEFDDLDLPLIPDVNLPDFPEEINPGEDCISLDRNDDLELDAGEYGRLALSRGSVLYLTGGAYTFSSIECARNSSIHIENESELRVAGKFKTGRNCYIGPSDTNQEIDASDVVFYVAGQNGRHGGAWGFPKAVQIGIDNEIFANIYAPNGTVWLKSGTNLDGGLIADWILLGVRSSVTFDGGFYFHGSMVASFEPAPSIDETVFPTTTELLSVNPNPFNSELTFLFKVAKAQTVNVRVFDVNGRLIGHLLNRIMDVGQHSITWNAGSNPSGTYIVMFETPGYCRSKKITLIR